MASRSLCPTALFGLVGVIALAGAALGAPQSQEKKKTHMVVRFVGYQDDGKYRYQGKPVMTLAVEPIEGGQPVQLVVPNKDMNANRIDPIPQVLDVVRNAKRGDPIKIELDDAKPRPWVTYVKPYTLKPGETDPHAYVFENTFRKEEGKGSYTAVVLSKFDEHTVVAVSQKRDKEGDMASDTAILGLLQNLKSGEVVEADIRPGGATPVLMGLERYAPPQNAKFVKASEQEIDGQKAPAVELERGGKPVTAIVAGKTVGKRWVPDAKVMAAVKKLKPDAEVVFRARDDGGKLWLKEIEPAPKKDGEEGSAVSRGSRTASREPSSRERAGGVDKKKMEGTEKGLGDK